MNHNLLMSGVDFFDDNQAINPFMNSDIEIDRKKAALEHTAARTAFEQAGMMVRQVTPPANCQDGVYTANWAFILDRIAVMSRLPNARKGEEAYAEAILKNLGYRTLHPPEDWLFSGQGDMLFIPGTRTIIGGYGYRSDRRTHQFIADTFGCEVISLHSIPQRSLFGRPNLTIGKPVINRSSGLPDSPAYDIDLAVGILRGASDGPDGSKPLVGYCPDLLDAASRRALASRDDMEFIKVTRKEAVRAYACNLVSTGSSVVLNGEARNFIKQIQTAGLRTIPLTNEEISKGGGGYRCMSLTLDNALV